MIHRGSVATFRRVALVATAAGIAGATLVAPAATAAPTAAGPAASTRLQVEAGQAALASTLEQRLGSRTAGSYLDGSGALVVTVVDAASAATVRAAGAQAKVVDRSAAELRAVTAGLDRYQGTVGTAWSTDPVTNQVVLTVTEQASGPRLAALLAAAKQYGSAVRVEQVPGALSRFIAGGDAIYTTSARCSLGFNVRSSSGTNYFLTAGHCTNIGQTWWANSSRTTTLGTRAGSSFPGNDYGIVQYTNTSITKSGTVGSQDITSAGNATVGQTVTRRGSTTGIHSGRVTALNATVNYAEGTVRQMIRTTVCAEPGDSGGALYAGTVALGLTSGGNGNCSSGGTTFFQPVTEALSTYGVSVF